MPNTPGRKIIFKYVSFLNGSQYFEVSENVFSLAAQRLSFDYSLPINKALEIFYTIILEKTVNHIPTNKLLGTLAKEFYYEGFNERNNYIVEKIK